MKKFASKHLLIQEPSSEEKILFGVQEECTRLRQHYTFSYICFIGMLNSDSGLIIRVLKTYIGLGIKTGRIGFARPYRVQRY